VKATGYGVDSWCVAMFKHQCIYEPQSEPEHNHLYTWYIVVPTLMWDLGFRMEETTSSYGGKLLIYSISRF